jgi:hypothetical protein
MHEVRRLVGLHWLVAPSSLAPALAMKPDPEGSRAGSCYKE